MNKRLLTVASAVLVFGVALSGSRAVAQSGSADNHKEHRGRMSADQQLHRLSETLSLTDDQKGQVKPVLEDMHQQMKSIHADSSLSAEDKKSKMRSIFEEGHSKIRAVLNEAQQQKFDELQARRRERMEKHEGTNK